MLFPGTNIGFDGAIFDFDGTLMDSMPDWAGKMLHLLDSHGVAYPDDIIRTITPLGDGGAANLFRQQLGLDMSLADIQKELDEYALPKYRDTILPKPGVVQLLEWMVAAGLPVCILTASPQHMIRPCLARNRMGHYFSFAWSCDDLGMKKNDPAIYHRTCAQLGTDPARTLFFDDNMLALTTAKEAGLVSVGVWDASSAGDEAAIRAAVRHYIRDWRDIPL